MNWQELSIGLLGIISAAGGWFLRQLWDAVTKLKDDMRSLESDLRTNFARRDDMREMFNDLLAAIRRVEDRLDGNHK